MDPTDEQIMKWTAAGNSVRILASGTIVVSPQKGGPLSGAERAKRFRDKAKHSNTAVTLEPETVTKVTQIVKSESNDSLPLSPSLDSPPLAHPPASQPVRTKRFEPPSLPDWIAYAKTLTPSFPPSEAERAWNHYESNGWRVGKNPAKNWQACCRKCHGNWRNESLLLPMSGRRKDDPANTPVDDTKWKNPRFQ